MANGQRALEAVNRQRQALELRLAGKQYVEIAEALGYANHSGAYRAVQTALKKTLQEPADEVRKLELSRLDTLLSELWEKNDRPIYVDRILRIMERRSKLLGLDAPEKHDLTTAGEPIRFIEKVIEVAPDDPEA